MSNDPDEEEDSRIYITDDTTVQPRAAKPLLRQIGFNIPKTSSLSPTTTIRRDL